MATKKTDNSLGKFSPERLRLGQNFQAELGTEKILTRILVRKPNKQEFFRTRGKEHWLTTTAFEWHEDQEYYIAAPEIISFLPLDTNPVLLVPKINKQGVLGLWPIKLPSPEGRMSPWTESALNAAELAIEHWIRISAKMSMGMYEVVHAKSELSEPEWPNLTLEQILEKAFHDRYIDAPDHPILKKLNGEI
jgi:hypothetical protein